MLVSKLTCCFMIIRPTCARTEYSEARFRHGKSDSIQNSLAAKLQKNKHPVVKCQAKNGMLQPSTIGDGHCCLEKCCSLCMATT